jgi:hypothetical protein
MDIKELWLEGNAYIKLAQNTIKMWTVITTAITQTSISIKGGNFL